MNINKEEAVIILELASLEHSRGGASEDVARLVDRITTAFPHIEKSLTSREAGFIKDLLEVKFG